MAASSPPRPRNATAERALGPGHVPHGFDLGPRIAQGRLDGAIARQIALGDVELVVGRRGRAVDRNLDADEGKIDGLDDGRTTPIEKRFASKDRDPNSIPSRWAMR
jgi:hypothetical protein